MYIAPTKDELTGRIARLYKAVNESGESWDAVLVADKINQYYLTGTMQEGLFVLKNDGSYGYFVRKSYERARLESPLEEIYPMTGYRDMLSFLRQELSCVYIETEVFTYGMMDRLKKYFSVDKILPADRLLLKQRGVKSAYEISLMKEAGRQHKRLMEDIVPGLLEAGISEAEFTARLYNEMIKLGYMGVTRFAMFQTDMIIGQIAFGENSLYPTAFDGPGGNKGMSPAVPTVGSRERLLKKGDLVFVDIGYGYDGYHTDRTQLYMFDAEPSREMIEIHEKCRRIEADVAAQLKPGNIPSEIYRSIMSGLDEDFKKNFMGGPRIKFVGHGVGLKVDEYPVIAAGFDEPLAENMTFAVEPKWAMPGVGLLGVEDTYAVGPSGGICLTGGEKEIMVVRP